MVKLADSLISTVYRTLGYSLEVGFTILIMKLELSLPYWNVSRSSI